MFLINKILQFSLFSTIFVQSSLITSIEHTCAINYVIWYSSLALAVVFQGHEIAFTEFIVTDELFSFRTLFISSGVRNTGAGQSPKAASRQNNKIVERNNVCIFRS